MSKTADRVLGVHGFVIWRLQVHVQNAIDVTALRASTRKDHVTKIVLHGQFRFVFQQIITCVPVVELYCNAEFVMAAFRTFVDLCAALAMDLCRRIHFAVISVDVTVKDTCLQYRHSIVDSMDQQNMDRPCSLGCSLREDSRGRGKLRRPPTLAQV